MHNLRTAGCYRASIVAALCISTATHADTPDVLYLGTRLKDPRPIEELPESIEAKDGIISLIADFSDVGPRHVTLYLVNRTSDGIAFSTQDRNPYLMLEAMRDDGTWVRAQPHGYSWCGNSYYLSSTLKPNHFFHLGGYLPQGGEKRTVRYRVYADNAYIVDDNVGQTNSMLRASQLRRNGKTIPIELASNSGTGRATLLDIKAARNDKLATGHADCDKLRKIVLQSGHSRRVSLSRLHAVRSLKRCRDGHTAAFLAPLLDDEDRAIRLAAVKTIGTIAEDSYGAELRFKKIIEGDNRELRDAAIEHLSDRPPSLEVLGYATYLLADKDPKTRIKAVRVLGRFWCRFPEALTAIQGLANDTAPGVQEEIEKALIPTYEWCPLPTEQQE